MSDKPREWDSVPPGLIKYANSILPTEGMRWYESDRVIKNLLFAYEKLKAENERLASGLYRDDHRYHPLKETCDQLREENERLKAERDAIKSEHKRRLIDFEHNKSWVAEWMQERDTLKAKLAEVEAALKYDVDKIEAAYLDQIAKLQNQLTREREAARVMREALDKVKQFCVWLSEDSNKYRGTEAATAAQRELANIVGALYEADEIRGGE